MSRRVDNADGSFGGVVIALIDCEALSESYRDFKLGRNGAIWMMTEKAVLVARQPPMAAAVGTNFEDAPFVRDYREHGPTGSGGKRLGRGRPRPKSAAIVRCRAIHSWFSCRLQRTTC